MGNISRKRISAERDANQAKKQPPDTFGGANRTNSGITFAAIHIAELL